MTNRIGGDWSSEAIEAFRSAYGQQILTPQDQDMESRMGLPGSEISNTSPWIAHTGLWKYPSGKGPDEDLQKPFNPDAYLIQEEEEVEALVSESDIDDYIDSLDPEELLALAEELGVSQETDYDQGVMSDEEIENLIEELTND